MKEREKCPICAENKQQRWGQQLPLSNYLKIKCEILGLNSDFCIFNGWASSVILAHSNSRSGCWSTSPELKCGKEQVAGVPASTLKDEKEFLFSNLSSFFLFTLLCTLNNVSCFLHDGPNKYVVVFFHTRCLNKHEAPPLWLHVLSIHPRSEFAIQPASTRSHPESCFCLEVFSGLGEVSEVLQKHFFPFLAASVSYWSYRPRY